jgi:glycosyltransferase involved in cell wall biosynthesis
MKKNTPLISVVMPVLNGEKYIGEAVKSVLNQTFKKFELIIINDGSTDNTLKVIDQFKDKRIRIIINEKNLGLVKAINKGIFAAKGKYIARCDADDINKEDRFKKQIDFLEKNSNYVLVGSTVELIDELGKKIDESLVRKGYNSLPITDAQIRKEVLVRNPISHPSIMIRKSL